MSNLEYITLEGFRLTAQGMRAIDRELRKQKKTNRNVALLLASVTVYICTNEIRMRYQEKEIEKLRKKVREIEKG